FPPFLSRYHPGRGRGLPPRAPASRAAAGLILWCSFISLSLPLLLTSVFDSLSVWADSLPSSLRFLLPLLLLLEPPRSLSFALWPVLLLSLCSNSPLPSDEQRLLLHDAHSISVHGFSSPFGSAPRQFSNCFTVSAF